MRNESADWSGRCDRCDRRESREPSRAAAPAQDL